MFCFARESGLQRWREILWEPGERLNQSLICCIHTCLLFLHIC